ncbi:MULTISPECIES: LysR family transcriptional regulator [unclassified Francisella]|uniref:LysR family transcriptional regulator n=1 Tax=unclassified Francisella TaxID=2610885 RepID=UPI002E3455E4|nr:MULTISPECIES: LysR family transcriptional regulator [unclassified Francisella]MED7820185.1 LysR family transcriptional regulator [Francisella sp. 19S2-4]MED7831005.1 LysR family transcriptional regulator [Francisella sp. 19S2-10]
MNYDDIFLFIKLINIGTFTKLAESLRLSQSTVSRRIQNLEEELNTKLIKRNSRGLVEMTPEGADLYKKFSKIETDASNTLQVLLNSSKEIQGELRIGLPKLFFDNIIISKLDNFYARYPKVKLIFSYISGTVDLIKSNLDIAISIEKPIVQNCTVKTLITAKNKLYASKNYIEKNGMPTNVEDLSYHDVIGFINSNEYKENIVAFSEEDNSEKIIMINSNLFLNNVMCDISFAKKCNKIVNTLDIFSGDTEEIIPILNKYYFGQTDFYLIRGLGVRNNLEQEFVKFIQMCLYD